MSKTVWSITHFLCWVAVLVVGTANVHAAERGPLRVQNRYPLYILFLTPVPDTPMLIEPGQWQISLNADYTSVYINEQSRDWSVLMDMEMTILDLGLAYGLTPRLNIALRGNWISMQAGFLDGPLGTYHEIFGFPDYGRPDRPMDEFGYHLTVNGKDWVGVWWGFFTIFTILWVPEGDQASQATVSANPVTEGFQQLLSTLKKIRHLKTILIFLLAYWFYIDGVDTIIRMAVDYGMSIGFEPNDLIKALLITQFVGFPSAIVFGKLGQKWDVRKSIYLAIGIYICVTIWGTMMTQKYEFYVLAIVIGLVQGGIQALSRSYYSRLIPPDKTAEFYGFYNMLGKFAAILGPLLIGIVGLVVRRVLMPDSPTPEQIEQVGILASRIGIGSILILFFTGAILFYFVDEEKGKAELAVLSEE